MATKIGDLVVNVDGDINKLRAEMRAAVGVVNSTVNDIQARTVALKSGFDSVLNPIRNVTGMLGPLAAGFGAVMSINAFGNMISQSVEAAARLHDLSMQTGVSVEALSGLASVGKLSDVSLDMIAGSANKMSKNLSSATEEGKGAAAALRAMNIDFESFRNLSPDQQMLTVANAMENFADGGGKTAAAMALMGKEGAAMIPFLKDLAAQGEINAKVTSEQAAMADNYGDNLVKIRGQSEAWKKHLAMSFLPVMDEVTSAYLEATSSNAGFGASIKRNASDGTFTNWARNAVIALTYLVDVGHGLLSVFDLIGTAIGGAMAATSTIFSSIYDAYNKMKSGDLRGAWEEIKSGARQTSTIAKETGKDIAAIWNQELLGEKIRKGMDAAQAARKQIAAEDAKPQIAMSAFAAPEKAAAAEVKANDEKRKAYDSLIKSINEKIAVQEQEQQGSQALTEAQKLSAKVMVDLRDGVLTLDETDAAHVGTLLEKLLAEEKSNLTKKEMIKLGAELIKSGNDQVKSLDAQIEAALRSNEELGMSKEQIDALSRSRMDLAAASDEELASNMRLAANYAGDLKDAYLDYADSLDEAAKKKRMLIQIKADGAEKQAIVEETKRQLQSIEEESKRFYDDIYRGLSDSLYRGFESGKGFGKSFMDGIKNLFKTTVLKIAVQGVMTGVLGMGAMGTANASPLASMSNIAGGGVNSFSSIANMATAGKSLWDGFATAGTLGNGFWGSLAGGLNGAGVGSGLTSSLGLNMGNYLQGALGNNLAGSLSSGISSISAAMPYAAAAIAAFQISKSINGGYRLGGLSADAGALLGFAPRLFGLQDKQMGGQTVTGALGTQDLMRNQAWSQKGGLFRSDRAGTWSYGLKDSTAIQDGKAYVDSASLDSDKALLNGLNAGYAAIKSASTEFANALGLNAESIAQRTDQLNLTLGKTQEETNAAIQKTFAGIADSIALQLLPGVRELSKEDENAAATLARVANQFVVINHTFDDLGLKLFEMSDAGIKASDKFALAIGGLDTLKSVTSTYYENFFTQEERSATLMKSLSAEFEKQNLALPNSREGYRALVEEVSKLGTPEQLASLLKLNEAFASVVPATERLVAGAALVTSAADKTASILQERQSLQERLDQLTMSSSQLLRKQRDALDESNQALFDQVQAATNTKAAQEAQTLAAQTNADALASINASYQQQIDALIKASLPLAEQRAMESRGMDDSTLALFNRRNALEDEVTASKEATAAAQQLTSTLKASASDSLAALGKSVATEKVGAKSSLDAKIAIINAQKSAAAASFQWSKMAGEASIKTATEANQKIGALAGSLKSTLDGMRLSATQASDRIAAQAQISQALTLAKSTGILPDVNFLSDALKTVSQPNESLFSSYTEFARDFYVTAGQIADLNAITGDALSKSDAMVEMAKAQLASTEQAAAASAAGFDEQIKKAQEEYDLQISQFDQVMTNAQAQLEAALGTNVAILSMADALRGFQSSLGAMMSAKTTHPAAGSVTNTSSQKTGAAASLDSFKASLRSQPNYSAAIDAGGGYQFAYDAWANGSHANGLDFVPFDGYRAELHQGEMVLPAHVAQSVRGAPAGGGNSDLTRELLEEMRQMKNEIILLKHAAIKTSDNTKQAADILDSVTEGGSVMRTEEV